MSPTRLGNHTHTPRFPRVSGDEPATYTGNMARELFSPRERG